MKKGFTLSEALITLVIIGIVAAISIPTLNKSLPNADKTTYQKALYNIQMSVLELMGAPEAYASTNYLNDTDYPDSEFCEKIASSMNTTGKINCEATSSYDAPNFISIDGIRYWGFEGKNYLETDAKGKKARNIYVDRKLSSKEKSTLSKKRDEKHTDPGMKIQVSYDGKVQTGTGENWDFENEIVKSFVKK